MGSEMCIRDSLHRVNPLNDHGGPGHVNFADNANERADEAATSPSRAGASLERFVCKLCDADISEKSRKRHMDIHWVEYTCLLCPPGVSGFSNARYKQLWKHVLDNHSSDLVRDERMSAEPCNPSKWCALACKVCQMKFTIRRAPGLTEKAAIAGARQSLIAHCHWHQVGDSSRDWSCRVALNSRLLQSPIAELWQELLSGYQADPANVIAGLPEECARACANAFQSPLTREVLLNCLNWLVWAGLSRNDPQRAGSIRRQPLTDSLINDDQSMIDPLMSFGGHGHQSAAGSEMPLDEPAGPATTTTVLTSWSDINGDGTMEYIEAPITNPAIGSSSPSPRGKTITRGASDGHDIDVSTLFRAIDRDNTSFLAHTDTVYTHAAMMEMSHDRPEDEPELL